MEVTALSTAPRLRSVWFRSRRCSSLSFLVTTVCLIPWDEAHPQAGPEHPAIVGDVRDETTGLGVPQAFVQFVDRHGRTRSSAVTDADGSFELSGLPAGQFQLRVSRMGYATATTPHWFTDAGEVLSVTVRLHPEAVLLAPLEINAISRSASPVLANFYRRVDRHVGGTFFTREDIERRSPQYVTDLLLTVPGVRLISAGRGANRVPVIGRRGDCYAQVYIDGMRMHRPGDQLEDLEAYSIDAMVTPASVEGIEIYRGIASVPGEFWTPEARCGVIAIWTRRGGSGRN